MKILFYSGVAFSSIFALSVPAHSQDAGAVVDSARFYAGGHIGGIWGEGKLNTLALPLDSDASAIGGVLGGVEFSNGSFVAGVEADYGWGSREIKDSSGSCFGTMCGSNWNAHVRGRIGVEFDKLTLFVAGGWVFSEFEFQNFTGRVNKSATGTSLGGGIQYKIDDQWEVRLEFLHDRYGNLQTPGTNYNSDWSENTVRGAAIFKF